jgi:hypothetical protein
MRRQAAFEIQHLAAVLDAARHVEPLTVVAIVQLQRLIHEP